MAKKSILENKIYCEKCGSQMVYSDLLNPMVSYAEVYQCPNMCAVVDTHEVEGKILSAIRKNLFSMKRLVKIVEDTKLCYGELIAETAIKVFELRGQIMYMQQLIKTKKETNQMTAELFIELEDLQSALEKQEKFLNNQLTEEQLEFASAQKFMLVNLTQKEKRSLINKHVRKILCNGNGMQVYYELDNKPHAI